MKLLEDINCIIMEVEGGDANIMRRTSTNMVTCAVQVYEGGQTAQSYTLRDFLDELGVTSEDCQKAFEEGEE